MPIKNNLVECANICFRGLAYFGNKRSFFVGHTMLAHTYGKSKKNMFSFNIQNNSRCFFTDNGEKKNHDKHIPKDGLIVSAKLYELMKEKFSTEIGDVRPLSEEEDKFLADNDIVPARGLTELRKSVIGNSNVSILRLKEFQNKVDMKDVELLLPDLIHSFHDLIGGKTNFDKLIKVLQLAINSVVDKTKMSVGGVENDFYTSKDMDVYSLSTETLLDKKGPRNWVIVIFHFEAARVKDSLSVGPFQVNQDSLNINFLGMHIRERKWKRSQKKD